MSQVFFLDEAALELDDSVAYYEDVCKGLGLDFNKEVLKLIQAISQNPRIWPFDEVSETRRVSTARFPYNVVYYINKSDIWIVAVAHHKKFPNYWQDRLPSGRS